MPVGRSRAKDERRNITGSRYHNIANPQIKVVSKAVGRWSTSIDTVGNRTGVNALEIIHNEVWLPTLSGSQYNGLGVLLRNFNKYPIDLVLVPTPTTTAHPDPTFLEKNALAWKIQAESNPSVATLSLPTFLAEATDIPGLVKQGVDFMDTTERAFQTFRFIPKAVDYWARQTFKAVAAGHLSWRWALKPLLSDLNKMVDFVRSFDKRYRMLQNLSEKKSIRTRVNLGSSGTSTQPVNTNIHSELDNWTAWRVNSTHYKMWGSMQWNTTALTMIPQDCNEMIQQVIDLELGLNGYNALVAAWEKIPWSWFVDWFAGVGTVIQAKSNTLRLLPSKGCLMRRSTSKSTFSPRTNGSGWASISGMPNCSQTRLQRWPIAPTLPVPLASWPITTMGQWSILASLYVLNPGRRKRKGL